MMFGTLANLLNYRIDALLLAYFLATEQVGFYAAAVTVAETTLYLPRGIAQAAFPWISSTTRLPGRELPRQRIRNMVLILAAATSALAVLLILLAPVVIPPVFGLGFEAAVPAARVLLVATVFKVTLAVDFDVFPGEFLADPLKTGLADHL